MKMVVTLMVRDEVDIIAAMIEHHLAQGADLIIATDNGSVDGTAEVLQRYADLGVLELHHDPVYRKQQHALVTGMARRAYTEHGADWVVNADADEFWAPVDKRLTLRSALEAIPSAIRAFPVPVTNLVGPPAIRGSGIDRLVWRDIRTDAQLQAIGIYAQPTGDVVHRGDPEVVIAQGNHFVSIESTDPDPALALEVLHLPWRSWLQFERKVVNTGRSYEANPDLKPSKNHHGMADYRRHLAGRLWYAFLLRQPLEKDLAAEAANGTFAHEPWLRSYLRGLVDRAVAPDLVAACVDSSLDEPIEPGEHERAAEIGRLLMALERERDDALRQVDERDRVLAQRDRQIAAASGPRLGDRLVRARRRVFGAVRRRVQEWIPGR
jgi:hypothetical protein